MSAAGLARDANDGAVEPPSRGCRTADGCIASCQSVPDIPVGISLIGRPDTARRNSGIAPGVAWFAVFRFLAGFGVRGEWAVGAPLLHQSLVESRRVRIAGFLHTATPVGGLRAAGASSLVPVPGRRGLFMMGRAPALMALWCGPACRNRRAHPRRGRTAPGNAACSTWIMRGSPGQAQA